MQTIALKFQTALKDAILRDNLNVSNGLKAGSSSKVEKNDKLTATGIIEAAISPVLVSEETTRLCSSLEHHLRHLNERYQDTLRQFQELAIQVSIEIASAVVGYEVDHHETRICRLLEKLVSQHESPTPMVVHVNKIDLERLRIPIQETPSLDSMLQLKSDHSLARGDLRVESAEQRLLANCQLQLSNIQQQLMEYLFDARLESTDT